MAKTLATLLKTANWKSRPAQLGLLPHPSRLPFISPYPPQRRSHRARFLCLIIKMATKVRSAPAVCLSAPQPYDYGRLINKHKLIQEKRQPRYKHQICQSVTIFRQQMMLSFEGDLPETLL